MSGPIFAVEEITATNIALWTMLSGAIGGALSSMINGAITYRKTKDAGALAIVQATQANQSTQLATLTKQHLDCEERHTEAVRALAVAVKETADVKAELKEMRVIVVRDTQETAALRAQIADLASKVQMNRRPGEAAG